VPAGVVLYVSLCGVPPFWASSRRSLAESIVRQEVSFASAKWASVSEECQDLVRRMLTKSPRRRISATEILCKSNSVLYCTLLYCTVLYCTVLCSNTLCCVTLFVIQ